MNINFRKKYFKKTASCIVFIVFTLCIIIYLPCDIYNFKSSQKFSGKFLYNPYAASDTVWQKTNFHAHAIAWNGVTNGKQPAQTILNLYKQKGYAYSCISNYENVAKEDEEPNAINVYEHGYNIRKVHQLAIMPQHVCYNDFPLWQFASSKQFMINKLSNDAKAVVLAHPEIRNGYSYTDLKKLSGYNLMELLNHSVNSSDKWEIALSAGKPVWIVGDDDTHDTLDSNQTFTNWTMINCDQHNKDSLIQNLINGNAYAVNGKNAFNDNMLLNVKVDGMHVFMQLQNNADSIQLIGQNGIIRKVVFNTDKTGYTFHNNDTYIRAVVYNKQSRMYLNPVMRYDGRSKPQNVLTATINPVNTILYRGLLVICWLALFLLLYRNSVKQVLKLLRSKQVVNREIPSFIIE